MDTVLCNILSVLIQKHERIALPQLGAFYHDKTTDEINFNKFDSWNDERLEYAYCSETNLTFTDAKDKVAKFVQHLQSELNRHGRVELPTVGILTINTTEDSIDFTNLGLSSVGETILSESQTAVSENKEPDFFALDKEKERRQAQPQQNDQQSLPPIDTNFQYPPTMTHNKRSKPIHRWIILILFLLIGTFIILIYQIQKKIPDNAMSIHNSQDTSSLKENYDNYPIDVPNIDSNDLHITESIPSTTTTKKQVKKEKKEQVQKREKFYVIVGSRPSQKLAEEFQVSWTKKGYQCQIINANNKFRISIGSHATKEEADKQLTEIKIEVPDAWIFKE